MLYLLTLVASTLVALGGCQLEDVRPAADVAALLRTQLRGLAAQLEAGDAQQARRTLRLARQALVRVGDAPDGAPIALVLDEAGLLLGDAAAERDVHR